MSAENQLIWNKNIIRKIIIEAEHNLQLSERDWKESIKADDLCDIFNYTEDTVTVEFSVGKHIVRT